MIVLNKNNHNKDNPHIPKHYTCWHLNRTLYVFSGSELHEAATTFTATEQERHFDAMLDQG